MSRRIRPSARARPPGPARSWPARSPRTLQLALGGLDHGVRGDAETFVELLVRRAGPEALHADEDPVIADEALPAELHRRLDRDPDRGLADDLGLIGLGLGVEQLPAGGGDHAATDAFGFEPGPGVQRDRHFGA